MACFGFFNHYSKNLLIRDLLIFRKEKKFETLMVTNFFDKFSIISFSF